MFHIAFELSDYRVKLEILTALPHTSCSRCFFLFGFIVHCFFMRFALKMGFLPAHDRSLSRYLSIQTCTLSCWNSIFLVSLSMLLVFTVHVKYFTLHRFVLISFSLYGFRWIVERGILNRLMLIVKMFAKHFA